MTIHPVPGARVTYCTDDEAARRFEELCRNHMRLSAEEFLHRWDRGDYAGSDWDEVPGLQRVAMALPLVRRRG